MATRDRTRSYFKLQQGKFGLDIKKNKNFLTIRAVKHWTRLPSKAVGSPPLSQEAYLYPLKEKKNPKNRRSNLATLHLLGDSTGHLELCIKFGVKLFFLMYFFLSSHMHHSPVLLSTTIGSLRAIIPGTKGISCRLFLYYSCTVPPHLVFVYLE